MRKERTSVFGTVVLTIFVTSAVLVAGWFVAPRFLGQLTAAAPRAEVVAAPAPAPKRKAPRTKKDKTKAESDDASPSATDVAGAPATTGSGATRAEDETEATSATGRAPAAPADSEVPPRPAPESPTPAAEPAAAARSTDAHTDPRSVMEESQRRTEARFYRYDGLLQSFDASNKVTEKRWTFDREGSHGQSKAVLRFTAPAEVKGVALLIFNHQERASDQWMWTPAIERDRRIAMQDRSTRFFGTDFSFEDLEEHDVDQYDYAMLGHEMVDGAPCWKIQWTPKRSRASQYTRSIAWIRKDNYTLARLDNFVKDEVVKRLSYSAIENVQGIWTAQQLEMADLRKSTRTRLTLQQVKYDAPMKDQDFTLEAIRR